MREVKFRAWDEKNKTMIYPKGLLFDGRIVNFSYHFKNKEEYLEKARWYLNKLIELLKEDKK